MIKRVIGHGHSGFEEMVYSMGRGVEPRNLCLSESIFADFSLYAPDRH